MKRTKYGNIRSRCAQGKAHASKLEARRCDELHLLQQAKEISDLRAHPQSRFDLTVLNSLCHPTSVGEYVADFTYFTHTKIGLRNAFVIEDCKGVATPVYRLKKKLMLALYGIEVSEYPGVRNARMSAKRGRRSIPDKR